MKNIFFVLLISMLISFGFAKKVAPLPELMNPGIIEIRDSRIFILDGVTVRVYSLDDCRLLNTFGKNGQGPGELVYDPTNEIPIQMRLHQGRIVLNSQTKVIVFSQEGKVIREKKFSFMCIQIVARGNNFAVVKIGFEPRGVAFLDAQLLDSRLNKIKTLTTYRNQGSARQRRQILIPPPYIYMYPAGEKLFVFGGNQEDFYIRVFSAAGEQLTVLRKPYARILLDWSWKMKILDWLKSERSFERLPDHIKERFQFPHYLPCIRDLTIDDRRIYVQTYVMKNDLTEFVVLDMKGQSLKTVYLPESSGSVIKFNSNRTYTFHDNTYYYLVENQDDEQWELHVETIQ